MGGAAIAGEERVGAEQDRRADVVSQFRYDPVMQRRRVEEDPHSGQQRQHEPCGQAEAVKHRQGVQHGVGRAEIDPGGELAAIGQQVRMAQRDAFRRALGPGREQDRSRIGGRDAEPTMTLRREMPRPQPVQFVGQPDLGTQIFEPDDPGGFGEALGEQLQPGQLDKATRGDHGPHLRGPARRQDCVDPGCMVQHRWHPPGGLQAEEGDRGSNRIRHHQPNRLARLGNAGEPAAEDQAGGDNPVIGYRRRDRVGEDRVLAAMRPARRQ